MKTVAVIDYGMGNLHSVAKAIEHAAETPVRVVVTPDGGAIRGADRVVLPGVGAMRDCMNEMRRLGIDQVVADVVRTRPLLGVCVGMQALLEWSAENEGTECLGVLPGRVEFFGRDLVDTDSGRPLKVPHMGWNQVHQTLSHPMWEGIAQDTRFYFVHSYYAVPGDDALVAGTSRHGLTFAAALARENVFATQFHPEKSQHAGLKLYANFLQWDGEQQ